ncbi:MAG: nucleotidyltransferase family protein [Candidatus Nanoarchaeia archaeon]|nr:nucleotidyltransferase family protein [Candidatus Nanoarchaeia archaeon]
MIGVIPAAGEGTRMYPWIRAAPKEMILYGHKPVLVHCLDILKDCGVNEVCIITGHQKGALMDYIGNGENCGLHVDYTFQVERKGLGHAILCSEKRVMGSSSDSFIVFLGDTFVEPDNDIKKLIQNHNDKKPIASIIVEPVSDPSKYGIVKLENINNGIADIVDLFEKPNEEERKPFEIEGKYYVIAGVYVLNKKMFDYLKSTKPGYGGEIQLTDALKLALSNNEKMNAVILSGRRLDFGNWQNYLKMQKEFFTRISEEELKKISEELNSLAEKYRSNGK